MQLLLKNEAMLITQKKTRPAKRIKSGTLVEIKKSLSQEKLDFLPPEIKKIVESMPKKMSYNEQVILTLVAQIIVEIVLKEEI